MQQERHRGQTEIERFVPFKNTGPLPENCANDPLLTPQQVAKRLSVSVDWVWDHSSRKIPLLPVIRIGNRPGTGRGGILRYRASKVEDFIVEQERLSNARRKRSRSLKTCLWT